MLLIIIYFYTARAAFVFTQTMESKVEKVSIKTKRRLQKWEPQLHEEDKKALFVKGGKTTELHSTIFKDLAALKKPLVNSFQKKNFARPFDDPTSIEFFSDKEKSALFMFGSHSKKRPGNIILGRTYDHHILDMFEFGIEKYQSLAHFKTHKIPVGTKPCLIFTGDEFDKTVEHQRLKNLLIDFFRGAKVSQLRLSGLEHVYNFCFVNDVLMIKSYRILLKESGLKTPRIELEEIGPFAELKLRRHKIASDEMFKVARKQPKAAKIKKKKNVQQDAFGSQMGKIHMQPQKFENLKRKKTKVIKRKASVNNEEVNKKAKDSNEDNDE